MGGETNPVSNLNTNKYKLVGGALSLDFVNTVAGRSSDPNKTGKPDYLELMRADRLENYPDLLAWSLKAGIVSESEASRLLESAAKEPAAAEKVLRRASLLRESVYRLFKAAIEGWKPDAADLETLNRELSIAGQSESLTYNNGGFGWKWDASGTALDYSLWQVAQSAAEILTSGNLTRLRQCGGDACGWLFLDTSRNGSRRWCDMKDCGNLAKVRRFRQKDI